MSCPLEQLLGATVVNGQKQPIPVTSISSSKVVGLYFSAHWCPPCRGFTPVLAEFYKKMQDKFEVVFVSSDKDEAQWAEYFGEMPWLALPFADRTKKDALSQKYGVHGIPTLVLIDGHTAATINPNARQLVVQNPTGAGFPWKQ
jgi:nucleoredoxin